MTLRESNTDSNPVSQARFSGRLVGFNPRRRNAVCKALISKSLTDDRRRMSVWFARLYNIFQQ